MPKLYPAQAFKPMTQIPGPQKSNPLAGRPVMQNMGNEPAQGFLGNPQQKPQIPKQQLTGTKGWKLGVNIAQQQATNPVMHTYLGIRNSVTQPKQAEAVSSMTDILSHFIIHRAPDSITKALGLR